MPALLASFTAQWQTAEPSFCDYFEREWLPKAELWVTAYRGPNVPTTNNALESYHGVTKQLFVCNVRCAGSVPRHGMS